MKRIFYTMILVMTLMLSGMVIANCQSIDESNEVCDVGFMEEIWDVDWTVNWSVPSYYQNVGMFTYVKALGRFKLANGSYQNANDVTVKSYSSGMKSGNVNFSYSTNIPLLFLSQMPSGAQWLEWKLEWRSTVNWGYAPNEGFVTDSFTESSWRTHTY